MFHGYRGNAKRDMSSGIKRAFACNRNALIVDQRASGHSQGHIITFGINERKDVIKWIDKVIEEFGNDVKKSYTYVNGELVDKTYDMHRSYKFDVTDKLKDKKSYIVGMTFLVLYAYAYPYTSLLHGFSYLSVCFSTFPLPDEYRKSRFIVF